MFGYVAKWPKVRVGLTLAASLIALPLIAGTAAAQPTSAQQAAIKSSCQSDFRANCSGVSPGGEAALACLQQNVAKLSAACQQAVNAASGTAAPAADTAPATNPAPAAKPAPATKPAPAVAAPPPNLTPRQEMMLVRQSCSADFRRYCSTVPLGRGNGVACLSANAARLSAGCKQALAAAAR